MCNFLRDNDEQMPKEIHVHPTVTMCSSLRDNTDEMPIEIHVQPTYVAMCSSLRGNLDQMPIEIHVQPTYLAMCSSLRDNTDEKDAAAGSCAERVVMRSEPSRWRCELKRWFVYTEKRGRSSAATASGRGLAASHDRASTIKRQRDVRHRGSGSVAMETEMGHRIQGQEG
ncbi:uncharacterized protein V6R79_007831 [Siganus canaliculatus]